MTCLLIAGVLFIQTPDQLITVDDIAKVHLNQKENRIEFRFNHVAWEFIEDQTIESLVRCLKLTDETG